MPTSTRFALPVPPLTFKEKSSSSRENTVQSYLVTMGDSLDDDVNRLEAALGLTPDQTLAGINYSSNRIIVDGESPIQSLSRLDAAAAFDADFVHVNVAALTGTVYTANGSLTLTVNASTDVVTFSGTHGMAAGHPFRIKSTGTLPGGLSATTTYYAGTITTNTCKLYTSSANAIAGTSPVDITTTGSGTHSMNGAVLHGVGTNMNVVLIVGNYIFIDGLTQQVYNVSNIESNTVLTLTTEINQIAANSIYRKLDKLTYPVVFSGQVKLTNDPLLGDDAVRYSYLQAQLTALQATIAKYPIGYMQGPAPLWKSATLVTIKAGTGFWSDDKSTDIYLSADLDISTATVGPAGLDATKTNSTWYYPWLVKKSSDGTVSAIMSASNTAPTLTGALAGYDKKRMLPMAFKVDGSGNLMEVVITEGWPFMPYVEYNTQMIYSSDPTQVYNAESSSPFVAKDLSAFIPPISTAGKLSVQLNVSSTFGFYHRPTGATHAGKLAFSAPGTVTNPCIDIITNGSQSLDWKGTGGSVSGSVAGYKINKYANGF